MIFIDDGKHKKVIQRKIYIIIVVCYVCCVFCFLSSCVENTSLAVRSQRSQLELDVLRERLKEEEEAAAQLAQSKQQLVDELEVSIRLILIDLKKD